MNSLLDEISRYRCEQFRTTFVISSPQGIYFLAVLILMDKKVENLYNAIWGRYNFTDGLEAQDRGELKELYCCPEVENHILKFYYSF